MSIRNTAVLIAALLGVHGCTADAPEGEDVPISTTPATEEAAPAQTALTDPQIAHIAVTANSIDIETARLVDSRTTTPEVRAFAETMIRDHTAVNEQAAALARRLSVTPEENDVSRSLLDGAAQASAELQPLEGEAFDRAYIDREVAYHAAVLDAIDQTLIPGASNQELRGLLQEVRPAIEAHLEHARSLQATQTAAR